MTTNSRVVKRLIDLAAGTACLALAVVLLPFVYLNNLLEGNGPLFYRQQRLGLGEQRFELFKFRTMVTDAEANGPKWAEPADDRTTRLGRWMRRLHLDELPQGLNILRGEMSFVGPRPERPQFVALLEKEIPSYHSRHSVLPGLTGWAQVNYPYGSTLEDAIAKHEYD